MLCKCGCKEEVKPGNKYLPGHNARLPKMRNRTKNMGISNKGKKYSEEHKRKLGLIRKGKKHSEETKKKMSLASKGRGHTEETKLKIKEARKHQVFSKETRKKMAKAAQGNKRALGNKHTKETKLIISQTHKNKSQSSEHLFNRSGENHPNWKGGISNAPYCFSWPIITKAIKEKYEGKCQNPFCDNKRTEITTHHINYNKEDCDGKNLIALCSSCNTKTNKDRGWHQAFYTEIKRRENDNRYCNH